jgi:hypothetical protein
MGLFTGRASVPQEPVLAPSHCDACGTRNVPGAPPVPFESITKEGVPLTICVDARECRRRWEAREAVQVKGLRG